MFLDVRKRCPAFLGPQGTQTSHSLPTCQESLGRQLQTLPLAWLRASLSCGLNTIAQAAAACFIEGGGSAPLAKGSLPPNNSAQSETEGGAWRREEEGSVPQGLGSGPLRGDEGLRFCSHTSVGEHARVYMHLGSHPRPAELDPPWCWQGWWGQGVMTWDLICLALGQWGEEAVLGGPGACTHVRAFVFRSVCSHVSKPQT